MCWFKGKCGWQLAGAEGQGSHCFLVAAALYRYIHTWRGRNGWADDVNHVLYNCLKALVLANRTRAELSVYWPAGIRDNPREVPLELWNLHVLTCTSIRASPFIP